MRANGHPLVICLARGLKTGRKVALALIMIFCPVFPRIVGQLVIIPDANERMPLMDCLKIRVTPIERVPGSVVFQDQYFVRRLHISL